MQGASAAFVREGLLDDREELVDFDLPGGLQIREGGVLLVVGEVISLLGDIKKWPFGLRSLFSFHWLKMLEKLPLDRFMDGFGEEVNRLLSSSPVEFANVALLCLRSQTGEESKLSLRFSTLSSLVGDAIEMLLGSSLLVKCGGLVRLPGL
jgi:hypothetical protein